MATSHLTNAQVAAQQEKLANFTLASLNEMPKLEQLQKLGSFIDVAAADPSGDFRVGCFAPQVLHFEEAKKFLIDQLVWSHWLRANEILRRHRALGIRDADWFDETTSGLQADKTNIFTRLFEDGSCVATVRAWNDHWGQAGYAWKFIVPQWLHLGDNFTDYMNLEFNLLRDEY